MLFLWILWAFDALITLLILYFFFIGVTDGPVSFFKIGILLLILAVVGSVMLGSLELVKHHYYIAAKLLLCVLAVPGFLYSIFILMLLGVKECK
jgi:hypothetical protein